MSLMRVGRAITANEFALWIAPILLRDRPILRPAQQQVTATNEVKGNSFSHLPCPETRNIGIAVSGGVDSMALATLLATHVQGQRNSLQTQLHAMIVDHKLRDNSTEEASYVAEQIRRLGMSF